MAHLIDLSNHRSNMAYVGETPWHGLGQKLTETAPLEIWAREAGMEHSIERSRVAYRWGPNPGEVGVIDNQHVLYRSDTKAHLGVVSSRYKIVQPMEVLEFYRELVDATGDYQLDTAGVLDGGRKYWALARFKKDWDFSGNGRDIVRPYLFLASSADGTMATTAMHTSVRVVCNNTLQMGLRQDGAQGVKVSHATEFDSDSVKTRLGIIETHRQYYNDVNSLIDKAMSREQAVEVLVDTVAKRDDKDEITNERQVKKMVAQIMDSMDNAPGARLENARDNAWGVMNAVTHYVDFKANARSNNNRFASGQFGLGARLKEKTFRALQAA